MHSILSRALSMGIPTILGASAGVVGKTMLGTGVHESIVLAIGDTITPRFSVTTDTVLRVSGSNVIAAHCGSSHIYLRTWQHIIQRSADTVDVSIPCAESPVPDTRTVASVEICFMPTDSATKYHLSADTSMDRAKIPFACDSTLNFPSMSPNQNQQVQKPPMRSALGSIMFDTVPRSAPRSTSVFP